MEDKLKFIIIAVILISLLAGILIFGSQKKEVKIETKSCLLYTSPSPRDRTRSRMPSSA